MLHPLSDAPRAGGKASVAQRLDACPISPGLAIGTAVPYLKDTVIERWRADDPAAELERLRSALQEVENTLEALTLLPPGTMEPELLELLEADLMLARDKGWRRKIETAIGTGLSAEAAVQRVREELRARMKAVSSDYIRERLMDLDDLGHRLLSELLGGKQDDPLDRLPADAILVCRSLSTTDLLRAIQKGLAGLVVMDATPSSHLAIIAASHRLPALGQCPAALTEIEADDPIILDAVNGQLIVRPDAAVRAEFDVHIRNRSAAQERVASALSQPCRSLDGVEMEVTANAGLLLDLDEISVLPDVGVGLYRTEMAFLVRNSPPGVEEQAKLYRRVLDRMPAARSSSGHWTSARTSN